MRALIAAAALAFTPVHAEITSHWSVGHDDPCCPPKTSRIVLDRDGPGWRQTEIDRLTAALLRPPVRTFDPDRLRFPVAELDMRAHRILNLGRSEILCPSLLPDMKSWTGRQRARFLAAVHEPGVVRAATLWNVDAGDGAVATYDPEIPRALRPLLAGKVNQTRVGDGWFEEYLVCKIAELQVASNEKAAHGQP
ncbi:MAG TPA: hypothetical protein VN224_10460 [Xanthomonadales bacterium]|nr:hypothetical protein [Xanthomonadales bacterium]